MIATLMLLAGAEIASSTEKLEEIVVTAERRESTLQSIGGSVTAITGDHVLQREFTDFSSLAASRGLTGWKSVRATEQKGCP